MKIDILTLFPEMFDGFINTSIIKRAIEKGLLEVNLINFRDYSPLNNKQVDDTPYGGGSGMILRCEPIFECLDSINTKDAYIIMLSPEGTKYKQSVAKRLLEHKHLIILCGHYEGIDQRVIDEIVDEEISIGDYVLTGGELPAMVLVDAVSRYVDGVISKESVEEESFSNGLLEYPQYTRPEIFLDKQVPEILKSR